MRLIDADALLHNTVNLESEAFKHLHTLESTDCDENWKIANVVLTERTAFKYDIIDAPTVDAVPVVRCKDCKYWHYYGNGYHFCDIFLIANEFDSDSYDSCPDDFCSRGVIKNEKTTY